MTVAHAVTRRHAAVVLLVSSAAITMPDTSSAHPEQVQTGTSMPARTRHVAKGSFTVKMQPQSESGFGSNAANLGRLSLDKVFEGDLAGTGKGEMLTAMTMTKGSAGYVAIERFTGTLHGRTGGFVFQHSGSMDRGAQSLLINVVPDSGSGDLAGLEGTFTIRIDAGQHFYDFSYTLPQMVN